MSLYLGNTPIAVNSSSRNIGEIVQSTIPLTDAGLHLLDGSIISGSGSYSAFVTHIAGLVSGHSELFTTEADWQTAVTTYGVCGKFVYDSVNNTIRLPKYSDKIWSGLGTAGVKGNGMTLGLTDGTNNTGLYANVSSSPYLVQNNAGAYGDSVGTTHPSGALGNSKTLGITLDATKSGIIADLSTITTALDGYWYIVIATSTKTQIEVDIDEIATDLNGKADVDLSNCTKPHIIETYVNGTEWYRLYSDGWVEQGGICPSLGYTVTFLVTMADTNYTALGTSRNTSGNYAVRVQDITTTGMKLNSSASNTHQIWWEVFGMSAQS